MVAKVNQAFYRLNKDSVFGFNTDESLNPYNAEASAKEFYDRLKELKTSGLLPDKVVMQEWGVGRGAFMVQFLTRFLELDEEREFLDSFEYQAYDISKNVLDIAKGRLSHYIEKGRDGSLTRYENLYLMESRVRYVEQDVTQQLPNSDVPPIFVRFEELYDDIGGVELVEKTDSGWAFVRHTPRLPDGTVIETTDGRTIFAEEFIDDYLLADDVTRIEEIKNLPEIFQSLEYQDEVISLAELGEGYSADVKAYLESIDGRVAVGTRLPINLGAFESLAATVKIFDSEREGVLQLFDYGFDERFPSVQSMEANFEKGYGGHLTVAVNFDFLRFMIQRYFPDFELEVSQQREYQRRVVGDKIPESFDNENLFHLKVTIPSTDGNTMLATSSPVTNQDNASVTTYGGIDFNANNLNLKEQGHSADIKFTNFPTIQPDRVNG
ncbi:MAG: hypothetical protein KAR20_28930, partial [Candidatus Heimdallarchaeota archaeon]|nr:hypothetical protein [Candidatus Heimdallarchaeota archaeon]